MSGKVSNTLQLVRRLEARIGKVESEVAHVGAEVTLVRSDMNDGFAGVRSELVRVSTEIVAVVGAVNQVRDVLVERLDVRDKVAELDLRVAALERKAS